MSENKISKIMVIIYILVSACLIGVVGVFFNNGSNNGNAITVDGFMGPLTVEVTIENGVIKDAKVTKSTEGEFLPQSEEIIFNQAIEMGNADNLDVVAGATGTSKALISALQQALAQVGIGENVYTAVTDGRAGPLTVHVTIIDGVITDASVSDFPAGERIPEAADILTKAIENGHPNGLDVVAGASMTSRGLISALQQVYIKAKTDENSIVGYGEGYIGPLSVLVTTEGDTIVSAELLTISDSTFSLPTAETLLEQAVANGNADNLDVIAGATATSNGVITALKDAMSK